MAPIAWVEQRINKASAAAVRADLERLPALLDHVDELLAHGVIGGAEPNAADYQIAPSVCLLLAFDQLRPLIEARPAGAFATRVAPALPRPHTAGAAGRLGAVALSPGRSAARAPPVKCSPSVDGESRPLAHRLPTRASGLLSGAPVPGIGLHAVAAAIDRSRDACLR